MSCCHVVYIWYECSVKDRIRQYFEKIKDAENPPKRTHDEDMSFSFMPTP